jgi:hypothetical protein
LLKELQRANGRVPLHFAMQSRQAQQIGITGGPTKLLRSARLGGVPMLLENCGRFALACLALLP